MKDFFTEILKPVLDNIEKYPNKNAFYINDNFYTYEDFGKAISKIRKEIKTIEKDITRVGLVTNDDLETYASIFALWLENKCYVPLYPADPLIRCQQMIEQISIQFILDSSVNSRYSESITISTNNLFFDKIDFIYTDVCTDEELTYILFTSGSTGTPKAVPITRKNLITFINSFIGNACEFISDDKCLQCNNLTFDVSVHSYLIPLMYGACIYTVPQNQIAYSYIYGLLEDHDLTVAFLGPSTIRYLRPYFDEIKLPALKYCIFAGEGLPLDLLADWSKCIPNAIIENHYGPTECTTYCTYSQYNRSDISANKAYNGIFYIGKPYNHVKTIIIDSKNNEVPTGIQGELCLAGSQLTKGYLNNDEKNATSFFIKDDIRYYKTGDLCFVDDEGDIMFVGRLDSQVQVYGYRVEFGEIEFYAKNILNSTNVCVIAIENKIGNMEIVMFVESEPFDLKVFHENFRQTLPSYMIPNQIFFESQFPLNPNGKIDRNKLKTLMK